MNLYRFNILILKINFKKIIKIILIYLQSKIILKSNFYQSSQHVFSPGRANP
jgi:hypothetical protein